MNSADDRNHLLFITLLPVSDVLLEKAQFMYALRHCFIGIPLVDALLLPS